MDHWEEEEEEEEEKKKEKKKGGALIITILGPSLLACLLPFLPLST